MKSLILTPNQYADYVTAADIPSVNGCIEAGTRLTDMYPNGLLVTLDDDGRLEEVSAIVPWEIPHR